VIVFAVSAMLTIPFLVAAVRLLRIRGGYSTAGDLSIIEMRIRDIPLRPPLLGPYSRYGWNHPGPLLYWALTVPYWLSGRHPVGLALGALAINAAALVGMIVVARRRGGTPLVLMVGLITSVLVHALGMPFMLSSWNPLVTVVPFALFMMLAWSVAVCDFKAVPWLVLTGSFVAQSHVGYVPAVFAIGGIAVAALLWRVRRTGVAFPRRVLAWSTAIAVCSWIAPAIDAAVHRGGNARQLFRYFRSARDHVGWTTAWNVISNEMSVHAQWIRGLVRDPFTAEPVSAYRSSFPIALIALAACTLIAFRRRTAQHREVTVLGILATAVALTSIASITGTVYDYLTLWAVAVAVVVCIGVSAVVVTGVEHRPARPLRLVLAAAALATFALSVRSTQDATRFADPSDSGAHLVDAAATVLAHQGDMRASQVAVTPLAGLGSNQAGAGFLLELERRGIEIGVSRRKKFIYGAHRILHTRNPVLLGVSLVSRTQDIPQAIPGMTRVFEADDLTRTQRARYEAYATRVDALIASRQYGELARLRSIPRGGLILTIWRITDRARIEELLGSPE
jgi:hypothetical protein